MVVRNARKSRGLSLSRFRYSKASLADEGGTRGLVPEGQSLNFRAVFRQRARWSGSLSRPQEQVSFTSWCPNLRWYHVKSPWAERSAKNRCSTRRGKLSSGRGLTL